MAYEYTTQGYTVNDSGRRLVVDPVTRIEGHLRCEVNINDDNVITNAVSCGTMFRGLEIIVKDRDPRDIWAFVERICGVCTGTHALASVHAIEDALKIDIPDNANIIRNLMQLALWYHDHLVHFYQLGGLDWIDVVSASKADPKETSRLAQSLSPWPQSSPGYFASVKEKLVRIISTGQLGIFKNGYWGHPGYKFPPEANLMLVAHYIEALDFQKDVVQIHTVFGGKNPHPNWLVGGVPLALNINGKGGADVINMERLELVLSIIKRCREFSAQVLVPDSIALAKFYPEWLHLGTGLSNQSLLAYGAFPSIANDYSQKSLLIPGGAIINGNFNEVLPVDLSDEDQIREEVGRSWYTYPKGVTSLHPYQGETVPHFELGPATKGSRTDIKQLDENAPYSWIKTPRWRGNMMEVGPLARTLIAYQLKQPDIVARVDDLCARIGAPVTSLQSTMGRILTRAQEAHWAADTMQVFFDKLITNLKNGDSTAVFTNKWDPDTWPQEARGVGFTEAPRGALGHWTVIKNKKVDVYQCVVPTTWNAAPRSDGGQLGPYEAALLGTKMDVPKQPLEILRTLHSFDPCLACATHVLGPDGSELLTVHMDSGERHERTYSGRETHLCLPAADPHLALEHGALVSRAYPYGVHHRQAVAFAGRRPDLSLLHGLYPHGPLHRRIHHHHRPALAHHLRVLRQQILQTGFHHSVLEKKLVAGPAVGLPLVPVSRQDPARAHRAQSAGPARHDDLHQPAHHHDPDGLRHVRPIVRLGHPPAIPSGGGLHLLDRRQRAGSAQLPPLGYAVPHVLHHHSLVYGHP